MDKEINKISIAGTEYDIASNQRSYMEVVFRQDTTAVIDGIERTFAKGKHRIYDINSVFEIGKLPVTYVDCTHLDTSGWTSLRSMFAYNNAVTCKVDNLDTSNVTDMAFFAMGCYFLHEFEVGGFDTRKVTTMAYALTDLTRIRSINVGAWDTSNVTNMVGMFAGCAAPYYDLRGWDLSKCTNIGAMFYENTSANEIAFGEGFGKCAATNPVLDLSYCSDYKWGVQSLCDMYDRAANGMSTMTIKLHANSKALLTETQLQTLTSKGYTIL